LSDDPHPLGQVEAPVTFGVDCKLDAPHGPPHAHRLSPEQVVHELTEGGLRAKVSATVLPNQYIVEGTRP